MLDEDTRRAVRPSFLFSIDTNPMHRPFSTFTTNPSVLVKDYSNSKSLLTFTYLERLRTLKLNI